MASRWSTSTKTRSWGMPRSWSSAADADGIVPRPNVSLTDELVDLKVAEHSFGANLRVLQTEDAMMSSLLDILA